MLSKQFPPMAYFNLANIITTLVIVFGFLSALFMAKGEVVWSFTCFFFAIGGDTIDGQIARIMKQSSSFGIQLDSLADAVSFCVLPAFLAYLLTDGGIISIICCSLFIVSGIWRLAYFNITGLEETKDGACYIGVPTTIAASWFFIFVIWMLIIDVEILPILTNVFLLLASILMLSKLSYKKHGAVTKFILTFLPLSMFIFWVKIFWF